MGVAILKLAQKGFLGGVCNNCREEQVRDIGKESQSSLVMVEGVNERMGVTTGFLI